MKKQNFLQNYCNIADIQAKRLQQALVVLEPQIPITPAQLESFSHQQIAFLDMLTTRFGKLQDVIGARVFPLLLELLAEEATAFIDKLNKLEKLGYLTHASWWLELRELRNQIAHDYPDNALLCEHLNALIPKAHELLNFWISLKEKINNLNA